MNKRLYPLSYHHLQENEAGEFSIINRLAEILAQPPFFENIEPSSKGILGENCKEIIGIGDDCAVIPASILGKYLLMTVDSFVEGRHFLFSISDSREIGYKGAATAVSDIAAMGGQPRFLLINLMIPDGVELSKVEEIYRGINELCREFQISVVGGNTSSAKEFSFSCTVIGECHRPPLRRSTAQLHDDVWISGIPGLSQAGLSILRDKKEFDISEEFIKAAIARYQRPVPRVELGVKILEFGATAAIDLSDGIFQDAGHIAHQSKICIELDLAKLNILGVSERLCVELLSSGGDYELLFTAPRNRRDDMAGLSTNLGGEISLTRCGTVTAKAVNGSVEVRFGEKILTSGDLVKHFNLNGAGNDHFAKK